MPRLSLARIALVVAVILGVAGWAAFQRYWYYLPGIMATIRDPVGPNREVTWEKGPAARPAGTRPPNVVVILADDLGWNDITFNGGGVAGGAVPTPHIDSIGRTASTFTQAYAGNATCAPSRAAIMTGRYATRFGFEFTPAPVAFSKLIGTFAHGDSIAELYYSEREKDIPGSIDELTVPTSEMMIGQAHEDQGLSHHHPGQVASGRHAGDAAGSPRLRRGAGVLRRRLDVLPDERSAMSRIRSRTSTRSTSSCGRTCPSASGTMAASDSRRRDT